MIMDLDEAQKLAMETDYACEAVGEDINTGDAAAFFLEGYLHAQKQVNNNALLAGVVPSTLLSENKKFELQLLDRWGFADGGRGIDCKNQLKIFSLIEWLKENQY